MGFFRIISRGLKSLFRGRRLNQEMDEELRGYLDAAVEEKMQRGRSRAEALREARVEMGSEDSVKQKVWAVGWEGIIEDIWSDVRYGIRVLRKSPGFTTVVVAILALGIGANTAIFSLINFLMLRTLPVNDPQSLVILTWAAKRLPDTKLGDYFWGVCPVTPDTACSFSYPLFQQIRAQQRVFSGIFGYLPTRAAINVNGRVIRADGLYVTGDFFSTLGVRPALGRFLAPIDDSKTAMPAVVVSYRFWRDVLDGDQAAVGKFLSIGRTQFTIVGVTQSQPLDLDPGVPRDFWVPLSFQSLVNPHPMNLTAANTIWLQAVARLRPGVSAAQAASAISTIFSANTTSGPEAIFTPSDEPRIELTTAAHGMPSLRNAFAQPLYALFAAVVLILLIACANVAGLMLARSTARRREIAMRTALGATRSRLIRQLLTESLLLSLAGGTAGIVLGYWGAEALSAFLSRNWWRPLQVDVHPDWRVLAFTLLVSGFVGLTFGLAPAFASEKVNLVPALKEGVSGSEGATGGRRFTLGNTLVVVQMALAVLVLVGAGLLVRTLRNLETVNTGFDPRNLLIFGVDTTYSNHFSARAGGNLAVLSRELQEQLAVLPGVKSATYSEMPLLSGGHEQAVVYAENEPDSMLTVDFLSVAPGFFTTMRIPLLAGRSLNAQDSEDAQAARNLTYLHVVINEDLAHRLFGMQNPIGQHFRSGEPNSPLSEVVGVVGNAKYGDLREAMTPTIYGAVGSEGASFEVRTAIDPETLMPEIRNAVKYFDSNLLITDMKTQMEWIDQNIFLERLIADLSSLFALLALIVACVGIYGLLSYQVTRRTQEIGVRLALGAQQNDVLRLVIRQGAILVTLGVVIGTGASLALTRYLQSFLFEVKPYDPVTMIGVTLLLVVVALLASYIPARRAAKVDPMVALRYE